MERAFGRGTVLEGKYRVESMLGRGGMGVVLRVTHLHLGEELALKVLLPQDSTRSDATARFLREAQSAVRLRGEHVARVTDVGILQNGLPYIVMEYLRGVDLARELKRRKTLAPGEAVDYVLQACEALAEAHANGMVHRDVKPANLFLTTRPDGTPLIKVLDFGISKVPLTANHLATRTDVVLGTPGYMSPEQMKAARDVDARTDIWALGTVLYECLCGRRPFPGQAFSSVVLMVATEPPPPMATWIPRELQAAVLRCLEKDRAARFPSIAELAAALAPFARDQRAAATVVDRAKLMLHPPGHASEPAQAPGRSPEAVTLSDAAGTRRSRSPRRRDVVLTWAAVTMLVSGLVVLTVRSPSPFDELRNRTRSNVVQKPIASAVVAPTLPAAPAPDPPAPPSAAGTRNDDKTQFRTCTELYLAKDWLALDDCATGLAALGVVDKAAEFRNKATQERDNQAKDSQVRQAVRDGNLVEAQAVLQTIDEESIYARSLHDVFDKAESVAIDAMRRRAQALANLHDCTALKRLVAQQRVASTERVAAAAASVKCSAAVAVDAVPPAPANIPCDQMNVDDLMQLAQNQYAAGYPKSALQLVLKALTCKQELKLYRMAAMYACAAHDLPTAKLCLNKLPETVRGSIVQKCELEGLNLRSP